MSTQIQPEHFTNALYALLDETFDNVHVYYLDRGTSFFETLATVSAAEASVPVGGKCATLAAQVKHVTFYLDVLEQAGLVTTEKIGRVRTCKLGPRRLEEEAAWIERYREILEQNYRRLDALLETLQATPSKRTRKQD